MSSLNIGIMGTGGIVTRGHADALAHVSGLRLWSFLSRDRARALACARQFGAAAPRPDFDRLEEFLADPDLDAVLIATPDKLHAAQALAVAEAGKHIFLEKPMATSQAEVTAIQAAVQARNLRMGLSYRLRWHAGHRALVTKLRAGELGTIRHLRVLWAEQADNADNWRAHGELGRWWSLAALGTHGLDLIRWIMAGQDARPESLRTLVTRKIWAGPHDETALLTMAFASGATAELCSSYVFAAPTRLEVYGTEGWAVCEDTFGREGEGRIWTDAGPLAFEPRNPFVDMLADFAAAIRDNRPAEVDEIEGGHNVAMLLQAVTAEQQSESHDPGSA